MKISEIILNNYRAFYNEKGEENTKYRINLDDGKNMLIYGENGSGKSSLYKAVRDVFRSSTDPSCSIIQNAFSREAELDEQPFVQISFHGDETPYRFSSDPYKTNTAHELLRSVIARRSFMTYRDLMRIYFIDDPEVNLFDFLFGEEGLLAELQNPAFSRPETNLPIGKLLEKVTKDPDEVNVPDFVNGVNQILSDMNRSLNCLLGYFDNSLSINFSELTEEAVLEKGFVIRINTHYFGIPLSEEREQYHNFLNEARLSALAVCIFLAAHLSVPSAAYKILFLDDIFTGLDNSNRIPLLRILTDKIIEGTESDTFTEHQIMLTTYDRQWYELAKNHLNKSGWCFLEMYTDKYSRNFEQPSILPGTSDIEKAAHYFLRNDYPACANYQRKICERLIKQFLPDNKKYDALPNGDIVPVNKLDTFISRLESYLLENGMDFKPFEQLKNCLRVVMNPLSHDDPESPVFRKELELTFHIIGRLQKLKNTVVLEAGKEIRMKKVNPATGIETVYISQLLTPFRKLEYDGTVKISKVRILALTQKDGDQPKKKISFDGELEEIYGMFCHYLSTQKSENPFADFELMDGRQLSELLS